MSKRKWRDKHVLSHVAFVPSLVVAAVARTPPFWEVTLFVLPVLLVSTAFHRAHEPRGSVLARCDTLLARALFGYGIAQLVLAPTRGLALVYVLLAGCTAATHLGTARGSRAWDVWHSVGMHVIPGAWATLVAYYNDPLYWP